MQSYPTISIVTPSLNQGDFIEQTILSVLSQNYPALEYLVMDGGSTDNTLRILKKYNGQIKWISEQDKGQTHAINKGIRMSVGSIVGFLNADDLLAPGTLQKIAELFSSHNEVSWLTGNCHIIDENNREIRKAVTYYKSTLLRLSSFRLLLMTNYISQPATFWRRSVMDEIGLLDENLHYVMDYEYWLRLYSKYSPIITNEYLASFRVHQSSKTTTSGHNAIYIEEERDVIRRHAKSNSSVLLHNAHRLIMTLVYSIINYRHGSNS